MKKTIEELFFWWKQKPIVLRIVLFIFVFITLGLIILGKTVFDVFKKVNKQKDLESQNKEQVDEVYEATYEETKKREKEFWKNLSKEREKRKDLEKKRETDDKKTEDLHRDIDNADCFDDIADAIERVNKRT